jgi:hypothetical protein
MEVIVIYRLMSVFALGALLAGCTPAPATKPAASAYLCAPGYDYRVFEGLSVFSRLTDHAPRKDQTQQQRYDMDPGDPLWLLPDKPQVSCTSDHQLQLRYADTRAKDFATAPSRVTITIAHAGKLLDPILYDRAKSMANSLEETKLGLDVSECWPSVKDCKKMLSPNPQYFETYDDNYVYGYSPAKEFSDEFVKRSWQWFFKKDGYFINRIIFKTKDENFDVLTMVEHKLPVTGKNSELLLDAFYTLPIMISSDYGDRQSSMASSTKDKKP